MRARGEPPRVDIVQIINKRHKTNWDKRWRQRCERNYIGQGASGELVVICLGASSSGAKVLFAESERERNPATGSRSPRAFESYFVIRLHGTAVVRSEKLHSLFGAAAVDFPGCKFFVIASFCFKEHNIFTINQTCNSHLYLTYLSILH